MASTTEFDQKTWDLVEAKARELFKKPAPWVNFQPIVKLKEVKLTGLTTELIEPDEKGITGTPRIETIHAVNCGKSPQKWERTISTVKRNSITVTMNRTAMTSTTVSVEASGSLFGIKASAKFSKTDTLTLSETNTQTFSFDETVTQKEEYTIPGKTRFSVSTVLTDTNMLYRLKGRAIIDALFGAVYLPGGSIAFFSPSYSERWLSDQQFFSAQPGPREIELDGDVSVVESSDINLVYKETPIGLADPVCKLVEEADDPTGVFKRSEGNREIIEYMTYEGGQQR